MFIVKHGNGLAAWVPPLTWRALLDAVRLVTLPKFGLLYVLAWLCAITHKLWKPTEEAESWVQAFGFLVVPANAAFAADIRIQSHISAQASAGLRAGRLPACRRRVGQVAASHTLDCRFHSCRSIVEHREVSVSSF